MRWKVASTEVSENKSTGIKTTTKTKQLTITIGEAVGVGKTAVGAVQAASKTLKTLNKEYSKAGLAPFASTASVLANVIKSLDVYKKVMSVVEKVTPIVQLAARGSGMWCSPGNAGDIGQIVLGQVQKILVALVVSSINTLRDYVWNYEFVIAEIKESFEEEINKNIEELSEAVNSTALTDCIANLASDSSSDGSGDGSGSGSGDFSDSLLDGISSGTLDLSNSIDWNGDSDSKWFSTAYITEYSKNKNKRQLRGSIKNLGIQYSDDDGETWTQSEQKDGSWYCFAKILSNDKYVYVAGSKDFISSLKESSDSNWKKDTNYYYNDGENNLTLTKYYKDTNSFDGLDKDEFEASKGIYYSLDNGITWKSTNITNNINCLCEFEEKENYSATIVAGSDDFNGCFYTEDGITWTSSYTEDKWLQISANDETFRRVSRISVIDHNKVSALNVGTGSIFSGAVIVNFEAEISNLEISDAREDSVREYYEKMAELISEGKSVDEIYEELGELK